MLHRHRSLARFPHKGWWRKHSRAAILTIISAGFIFSGIIALWFSTLQIPDLSAFEARTVAQSTKIFDRTGEVLLYDVHADAKRTVVPFAEISDFIKKATVAIEDDRFYEHNGIVPMAILRAVLANITGRSLSQGGSTITQQVIKNSVLTTDKTITRKLKEWVLALKLERVLPKDEILSMYLNENPYGGNLYGVEVASKTFFGKSAKDVSLVEAAYIAAIPQAPTFYSPYGKNRDRLDARAKLVLSKMKELGYITDAEYNAAIKEKITFLERNSSGLRAPHFSMYVREYLIEKYGQRMVDQGGLKVVTTLDYSMQEAAENVVKRFAPSLEAQFNASNTAMIALNPKNGDILMMVGSRDYFDTKIEGNFNVTTALRQPGSTFKPFVYATAFMKGYTPETVLFDVPTEFSTQCTVEGKPKNPAADPKVCYSPTEYDGLFPGPMTIREALAHSRNIPAVKTLYLAGIRDSLSTARAMGITSLTNPDRYGLTLVLGGGEVTLLELTSAYGVFANDGVRNQYRAILRVEDSEGKVLEESHDFPDQVIDPQVARQINDILSDTKVRMSSLQAIGDSLGGKPVAIKTGTTNDFRDVWIAGYTPNLVVGAWAGKNDNTPMEKKVAGLIIAPLWGAFMAEVNDSLPKEYFRKPEPTPFDVKPVLRGNWQGGASYFIDSVSQKLATAATPPELRQEVIVPSVHSILHWVNKDDPRGAVPTNPSADSQYEYWEYGVRKWFEGWRAGNPNFIENTNFVQPTAVDDVHVPENSPRVTITSPARDSSVPLRSQVNVVFGVTSKYPFKKAELYVNDRYVYTNEQSPVSLTFVPQHLGLQPGANTIKVVVYDTALNRGEASETIVVTE